MQFLTISILSPIENKDYQGLADDKNVQNPGALHV
jgi:hypothetical protein